MPLEEIKALQKGERHLLTALEQHIHVLEQKKVDLEKSKNVCEYMRNDRVSYQTLNAQYYLNKFSEPDIENAKPFADDTLPIVYAPWRRYFARILDLSFYSAIWFVFAQLVLGVHMSKNTFAQSCTAWVIELVLLLCFEPLFLSRLGTTPGKWILGLSLMTQNDRKLTYSEAFSRTWRMLIYGLGLNLPFVSLYRLWRSYRLCTDKQTLHWEDSYVLVQKKDTFWKLLLYPVTYILIYGCMVLSVGISNIPEHRGDITAQEFCDNFNKLARQYDAFGGYLLQEDGTWKEPEYYAGSVLSIVKTTPDFIFETENGILKSISISESYIPDESNSTDSKVDFIPSYETALGIAMLAFVTAQEESTMFSNKMVSFLTELSEKYDNGWDDFSTTIYGISLTFDITKNGYSYANGMFISYKNVKEPFSIEFSMTKN